MDLTSLKAGPIKAMLQSSPSEVIGLHPLFGPGVDAITGNTIVICPARTEQWLDWVKNILTKHGATLIETTPERHDELMALVQALNHLNSITMGMILKEWGMDLAELIQFATPIFNTKLAIIKEIFTNNPRLYAEIITLNPHIDKILDLYRTTLSDIETLIKERDPGGFTDLMEKRNIWGIMSDQFRSAIRTIIVTRCSILFVDIEKTFDIIYLKIWHLSTFLAGILRGAVSQNA